MYIHPLFIMTMTDFTQKYILSGYDTILYSFAFFPILLWQGFTYTLTRLGTAYHSEKGYMSCNLQGSLDFRGKGDMNP